MICPYCQQKMPKLDVYQKEIALWRPWDTPDLPRVNLPSVWIESEITSTDFTTITDAPDTWAIITDFTTLDANGSYYYLSNLPK